MSQNTPNNKGLTPSDQLLGIFAVNFTIALWVGIAFVAWYDSIPDIPKWIYAAEGVILAVSFLFSVLDVVILRFRNIGEGVPNDDPPSVSVNVLFLKIAVIALTVLYVFVLWRLSEETGGVVSPFAPFLTAPALFAPFVTRNGATILILSIFVTLAIFVSSKTGTLGIDSTWPYKGTAGVMVLLAGVLTALRMRVAKKGAPLTGEGSGL